MARPSLVVVAGPNGSGKSSLISALRKNPAIDFGTYVNADDIELGLKRIKDLQARSREAQRLADETRELCFKGKTTFSFETVMSHPSKIALMEEARAAGYAVSLFFVAVDNPRTNVARVNQRVSLGGHSVPEDRIIARYGRTLALLPRAILAADEAAFFDNTAIGTGPRTVASVVRQDNGFEVTIYRNCEWLEREFLTFLPFSDLISGSTTKALVPEATLREIDHRRTADLTFP
jgi:predicted ABC-type ATPase